MQLRAPRIVMMLLRRDGVLQWCWEGGAWCPSQAPYRPWDTRSCRGVVVLGRWRLVPLRHHTAPGAPDHAGVWWCWGSGPWCPSQAPHQPWGTSQPASIFPQLLSGLRTAPSPVASPSISRTPSIALRPLPCPSPPQARHVLPCLTPGRGMSSPAPASPQAAPAGRAACQDQ